MKWKINNKIVLPKPKCNFIRNLFEFNILNRSICSTLAECPFGRAIKCVRDLCNFENKSERFCEWSRRPHNVSHSYCGCIGRMKGDGECISQREIIDLRASPFQEDRKKNVLFMWRKAMRTVPLDISISRRSNFWSTSWIEILNSKNYPTLIGAHTHAHNMHHNCCWPSLKLDF